MANLLAQTPLYDWHAAHGGRLVDFAGWQMPVQYTSIVAEHEATRTAAGLFDVSHMGRLFFAGPGAAAQLDRLVTRRVAGLQPGTVRYALVTNDAGGILDDVLVYALEPDSFAPGAAAAGGASWMLVVNAGNRGKIVDWIRRQNIPDHCQFRDATLETAMLAVQGPRAAELLTPLFGDAHRSIKYYHSRRLASADGHVALVSRTGYTGEDGWEIIVGADEAEAIWCGLLAAGAPVGAVAAGLGARDTLRLEAAMPLYGHELNENIDPYQAGLDFAVDLEGRTFPGRDALAKLRDGRDRPTRVGWLLDGRRVPREGYPVLAGERTVGYVTSGTFSPTLARPIAMGYAQPDYARPGTAVAIDIRGRPEPAHVVMLPFYRRPSAGSKS